MSDKVVGDVVKDIARKQQSREEYRQSRWTADGSKAGQWRTDRDDARGAGAGYGMFKSAFNIAFRAGLHALAYQHVTVPVAPSSKRLTTASFSSQSLALVPWMLGFGALLQAKTGWYVPAVT